MADQEIHTRFDDEQDGCPNCGGEGYVYSCFEEFACLDPEGGCDLCMRRCDWCRPARPPRTEPTDLPRSTDGTVDGGSCDL